MLTMRVLSHYCQISLQGDRFRCVIIQKQAKQRKNGVSASSAVDNKMREHECMHCDEQQILTATLIIHS